MVPINKTTRKIVRSYPGSGTADTIYVDEYGGHWLSGPGAIPPSANTTAPPMTGKLVGGTIVVSSKY